MESVFFVLLLCIFFGVLSVLWSVKDICDELNNIGRQLSSLEYNIVVTQKNTDDIRYELDGMDKHTALLCEKTEALMQGYDTLTQDIIRLMLGDPRKEGNDT